MIDENDILDWPKPAPPSEEPAPAPVTGEVIYNVFRKCSDKSGVASYGWAGMTDGYRQAWELFAKAIQKPKQQQTEQGTE